MCFYASVTLDAKLIPFVCTGILPGPKQFIRKPGRIKKEKYFNNSINVSNDEYHKQ